MKKDCGHDPAISLTTANFMSFMPFFMAFMVQPFFGLAPRLLRDSAQPNAKCWDSARVWFFPLIEHGLTG